MKKDIVKKYYKEIAQKEWRRLTRNSVNFLEFNTTMKFLKKYLPHRGLNILDAGGGPGRYTIELAKLGHQLTLLDYTPELLKIAQRQIKKAKVQKNVNQIVEGSIVNLSQFPNSHFDVVLCLGGPLSHVMKKQDRIRAIKELKRVIKKNGLLFISVIGRLAVIRSELLLFPEEIAKPLFLKVVKTGDYSGSCGFTAVHFFLAEELEKLLKNQRLKIMEMVGLEGFSSNAIKETNRLVKDKKAWCNWLKAHDKFCTHPAMVNTSEHFLAICKK